MSLPVKPPGAEVLARVDQALAGLAADNLIWLSGYLYGLARQPGSSGSAPAPAATGAAGTLWLLYGSQTGTARRLAESLQAELDADGIAATLKSLDQLRPRDLRGVQQALFVVSTHGDGEPPEGCRDFFDALQGERAPRLPQLHYAVLALGDASYPQFCAAGRLLDERLVALGANRVQERLDGDVDHARHAPDWLRRWRQQLPQTAVPAVLPAASVSPSAAGVKASAAAPVALELLANLPLTMPAALREVRHLELALEPGQLDWAPGDALGLRFSNPDVLVEPLLQGLGLAATTEVNIAGEKLDLVTALRERVEISRLSRSLLQAVASASADPELTRLLLPEARAELQDWLRRQQPLDLLRRHPQALSAQAIVDALPPLQQRLYSIASSPLLHADEIHLTVALRVEQRGERNAYGACSKALADLRPGERIGAWVEANERFRLPADDDRDLIMIGPGTGVAPFRAFLQQRVARGARGRHWLLSGCRHRGLDFLYQSEWLKARADGRLQRLDMAFSRDGAQRQYVQDLLRQHAATLYEWIEGGAHVYLCGDAFAMAPAVQAALTEVLARGTDGDAEAASARLQTLRHEGRLALDVY